MCRTVILRAPWGRGRCCAAAQTLGRGRDGVRERERAAELLWLHQGHWFSVMVFPAALASPWPPPSVLQSLAFSCDGFAFLPKGLSGSRAAEVPPSGNPEEMRWWRMPTSELFKCLVMHNGTWKQIDWYWCKLAESHFYCFLSLPRNPLLILVARLCQFIPQLHPLSGLRSRGQVYLADLFLGDPSPTWTWGTELPMYQLLTAYL